MDPEERMEDCERAVVLLRSGHTVAEAAKLMRVSVRTLYRLQRQHGVDIGVLRSVAIASLYGLIVRVAGRTDLDPEQQAAHLATVRDVLRSLEREHGS